VTLAVRDFEVIDGGVNRRIQDFRSDDSAVSIALLFDASGSMESRMGQAREAAEHLLSWMNFRGDEAAIFTFDTRLEEVMPFTEGLERLPSTMASVAPFGATSLHDAVARTAEKTATREGLRRAVVVFTDGRDNASRLTAGEVSGIASSIDVPVYIVGIRSVDRQPLVGIFDDDPRAVGTVRPAERPCNVDRGTRVCGEQRRRPKPDGAPDCRRAAAPVLDRV
jgi:VWFA-related protein